MCVLPLMEPLILSWLSSSSPLFTPTVVPSRLLFPLTNLLLQRYSLPSYPLGLVHALLNLHVDVDSAFSCGLSRQSPSFVASIPQLQLP